MAAVDVEKCSPVILLLLVGGAGRGDMRISYRLAYMALLVDAAVVAVVG